MTERINITVPGDLLAEIDTAASREHLTRSGFLRDAARERIARTGSAGQRTTAREAPAVYATVRQPERGNRPPARAWPPSRELALAALRAFFAARDDIAAAYLFGSTAADRADKQSDIDVAVLFGGDVASDARLSIQLDLAGRIGAVFGSDSVDVIALDEAPPHLVAAVLEEGIVVAGEHSARRLDFERAARAAATGQALEAEQRWEGFRERFVREGGAG